MLAQGYRPPTAEEYARLARRAAEAGDLLAPMREAKSKSAWTQARAMALAWARYTGMDRARVAVAAAAVPRPRAPVTETRPAAIEDWRRVVAAVERRPEPERSILLLVTTSGLRMGDVFRIAPETAREAAQGRAVALERKRGTVRTWAPAERLWGALGRLAAIPGWRTVQDLLGTDYRSAAKQLRRLLHEVAREAGVEYVRPHRYRHTVATALSAAGAELPEIQAVLAHASWKETMRYLHVDAEQQRAAARRIDQVLGDRK